MAIYVLYVSPLSFYTIHHLALEGIHRIMFGEEIARIRKLGVQGVSFDAPVYRPANKQLLFQALNFLTVIASGLMMWKGLCLVTNSESPIVVVLSQVSYVRTWVQLTE